jgi:hypothetical protein
MGGEEEDKFTKHVGLQTSAHKWLHDKQSINYVPNMLLLKYHSHSDSTL